ncbi:hypothetical protein ACQKOE_05465 [Novosphingobium sp. NPDC080210]|uniref:hypothetical protein n=1 Tax=Novosphingobium sp. NPDC080210 TaxID=3390596 RepID=UPI003CFEC6D8
MIHKASKLALAAAAALCLPAAAQAGTSTTTSTASFNVVQQCAVTGATVVVGTYIAGQTWLDLGKDIGYTTAPGAFTKGTKGNQYANFGSILCTNGTLYTINIKGSGGLGYINFNMNNKTYVLAPFVSKIGNFTISDASASYPTMGNNVANNSIGSIGTGLQQPILGSVIFMQTVDTFFTDTLPAGKYVDPLTYTLTF